MSKAYPVQDIFLRELCRNQVPVSVYLVSGIKLHGQIEAYDQFVVLLRHSVSQMIYKSAISTIMPTRNISLPPREAGEPV